MSRSRRHTPICGMTLPENYETDPAFWQMIAESRAATGPTISHEELEVELLKPNGPTSIKSLIRTVLTFLLIMGVLYGTVRVLLALR